MRYIVFIFMAIIYSADCSPKADTSSYVKITTTALNRDKYYPPIVICSDTGMSKILKDTFWTTFIIEPEVYAQLETYVKTIQRPLDPDNKGRCDHCFDISIFEKGEKVSGYEVKTNEESRQDVAEIEKILKQSPNNDYLIVLIKGYLSF